MQSTDLLYPALMPGPNVAHHQFTAGRAGTGPPIVPTSLVRSPSIRPTSLVSSPPGYHRTPLVITGPPWLALILTDSRHQKKGSPNNQPPLIPSAITPLIPSSRTHGEGMRI
jgi:hypothetical protein